MVYVIAVFILLLIVLCSAAYYFSKVVLYPKIFDYDKTCEMEIDLGGFTKEYFEGITKEEVSITSQYGYRLHGLWMPNDNSKKTIIFCHGITYTLFGSVKYMDIFYKRGFNVLMYDHRFHGKSGGSNCTFGYYEKFDLKTCVDWVFAKVGRNSVVGTHGESMGAATVLQHAAIDDRIAFVVADCPFESAAEEFKYRMKIEYKLPPFPMLYLASLFNKLKTGVFYKDMSPINNMGKIKTPILFIHGDQDTYVPHSNSLNMYNTKKEPKKLYLVPGAGHAQAYLTDKKGYEMVVEEFLRENNV